MKLILIRELIVLSLIVVSLAEDTPKTNCKTLTGMDTSIYLNSCCDSYSKCKRNCSISPECRLEFARCGFQACKGFFFYDFECLIDLLYAHCQLGEISYNTLKKCNDSTINIENLSWLSS